MQMIYDRGLYDVGLVHFLTICILVGTCHGLNDIPNYVDTMDHYLDEIR